MHYKSSENNSVILPEKKTQKKVIVALEYVSKIYLMGDVEVRALNEVSLTIAVSYTHLTLPTTNSV